MSEWIKILCVILIPIAVYVISRIVARGILQEIENFFRQQNKNKVKNYGTKKKEK